MQPVRGTCENCGKHPVTVRWSEGVIASLHGCFSSWCKGCVLRAQIAHAEERVKALDGLRAELTEWEEDNASSN